MSRFGPIHGYGAPAILNAWQEKKEQEKQDQLYAQKLGFEKEKFDFQKQQFQAQMDEKKIMRQAKVTADGFKLIDNAIKMYDKDGMFETAQSMMGEGLKRVTTAFPEIGKIDLSGVADAKEAKERLKEQTEAKLNQAWKQYTSGDESVLPVLKQILPRAMKTGIVDKDLAKFYTDQIQSGKKEAGPYTLSPGAKRFGPDNKMVSENPVLDTVRTQPSNLKKMIDERQALIGSGVPEDDPRIQAYDNKISGVDINLEDMSQDEIDTLAGTYILNGKMPALGRGKQSTKIRMAIAKSAARQMLGEGTNKTNPTDAALEMVSKQADTRSIQASLTFLDKQVSAMGSFVKNLGAQVDRVGELAKDLETFDTRLLNVPLRTLRGKVVGSPLQAKYDMFLTEIENEIGKLATGSTASIAELSATAQEKWAKIHDKNLDVKDMLELLEETRNAASLRYQSVSDQLNETRSRMRTRDYNNIEKPVRTKKPINQMSNDELLRELNAE